MPFGMCQSGNELSSGLRSNKATGNINDCASDDIRKEEGALFRAQRAWPADEQFGGGRIKQNGC
jgi:hypothetical protein